MVTPSWNDKQNSSIKVYVGYNGYKYDQPSMWVASGFTTPPTQSDWLENLGHTPLRYIIKF